MKQIMQISSYTDDRKSKYSSHHSNILKSAKNLYEKLFTKKKIYKIYKSSNKY